MLAIAKYYRLNRVSLKIVPYLCSCCEGDGLNAILSPSDISNLLNELLVELTLYGNERLQPDVNKRLIEASLK